MCVPMYESVTWILLMLCRKQVENSRREAEADGVHVPSTLQEYCQQNKKPPVHSSIEDDDLFEDDYYHDSSDENELDSMNDDDIEEDSGTS